MCTLVWQAVTDAPVLGLGELLAGEGAELRVELDWTPEILDLGGGLGIRYAGSPAPGTG